MIIIRVLKKIRAIIKRVKLCIIKQNVANTKLDKRCLLVYITEPFVMKNLESVHQNVWQVKQMVEILSEYGYIVDVAHWSSRKLFLTKKYDLVINIVPTKYPEIKKHLKKNGKRIAYLTTSNPSFQNNAENKRISDLELRKGVKIITRRYDAPYTKDIENYNACFMIGNEYNWKTYINEFKLKEPYYIKNTGHRQEYYFDENKKNKRSFLYFGSAGCVHKGLDLLLDVFSKENFPCELYVCGNFKNEKDLEQLYYKELYETKNIHPIGFVSIESDEFKELTEKCVYSIMPSCSEGLAGSVLTTMSAGLINICSRECGLEDDEVINLNDCSLETIEKTVLEYANKDDEWIKSESKRSYDVIHERYSKEKFVESLTKALDEVLK